MGIEQLFLFICAVRDLRKPMIGPIIFGSLAASNARGATPGTFALKLAA